jgi:hypothetical protein
MRRSLRLSRDAVWDEKSLALTVLRKASAKGADTHTRQLDGFESEPLSIYNPRNVPRSELKLSKDQIAAAKPDGYPTVIYGPAGCGKSVVITERGQRS